MVRVAGIRRGGDDRRHVVVPDFAPVLAALEDRSDLPSAQVDITPIEVEIFGGPGTCVDGR